MSRVSSWRTWTDEQNLGPWTNHTVCFPLNLLHVELPKEFHSNIHLQEDIFYINLRIPVSTHLEIFLWVQPEKLLIECEGLSARSRLAGWPLREPWLRTGAEWQWVSEVGWEEVSLFSGLDPNFFHTSHIWKWFLCLCNSVIELNNI